MSQNLQIPQNLQMSPANRSFFGFLPPVWVAFLVAVFAVGGLIDSIYLTTEHGKIVPCSVVEGCEKVLQSEYAEMFGIPTAAYGIAAYAVAFILAVSAIFGLRGAWTLLNLHSFTMLCFSLWFTYLQAFVIQAWCQYCLLSACFSGLIFAFSVGARFIARRY